MWIALLTACMPPEPSAPAVDCADLPQPPLTGRRIAAAATEDLDFDRYGLVVGSDFRSLLWSSHDGDVDAIVPGIDTPAGLRILPNDDLLVAAVATGEVLRLSPDGARTSLMTGLNWPNGLALLPDGRAVVTELSGGRVWWLDPTSGDGGVLADIDRANGVALAPDGSSVFVGTMIGAGQIWRVPLDGGAPVLEHNGIGAGDIDGLAFDVCGNLYVADYEGHKVLRITPDGDQDVLLDRTDEGSYLPGLRWGSGRRGWRADALYVAEPDTTTIYELDVGVPAAWATGL